jgi:uncharacterized membrane protein YfcA
MSIEAIALWSFIAGGIGTLTGFGTATIMVPILLLSFSVPETLLLTGIIHWFGNVWKVGLFWSGLRWRIILLFGIPGLFFAWVGARLVTETSNVFFAPTLGALLIIYVAYLIFHQHFQLPARTSTALFAGGLSGFLCGLFGFGGAIRSAFLTAFALPKAQYLTTLGAIGLIIDSGRLLTYWFEGTRVVNFGLASIGLFVFASLLGALVAKQIIDHIPQQHFRLVVGGFLLLVAARLIFLPV